MQKLEEALRELTIGALLHDVGKIAFRVKKLREEKATNHKDEGKRFLEEIGYGEFSSYAAHHHQPDFKEDPNMFVHVVHFADMMAAKEREEAEEFEWDVKVCLKVPVFKGSFHPHTIDDLSNNLIFPEEECDSGKVVNGYLKILEKLKSGLKEIKKPENPNAILNILEKTLFFVPSETNVGGGRTPDISLFSHLKLTAAFSSSLYLYLVQEVYKGDWTRLSDDDLRKVFEKEKPFLLAKGDISGIQKFIYNISSSKALRSLRARSLFLEILTNVIIDEILRKLKLYRTNVLYSGGGGFLLILPNTKETKSVLDEVKERVNSWVVENDHDIALVLAHEEFGREEIEDGDKYKEMYENLVSKLNEAKYSPYGLKELQMIFERKVEGRGQCHICGRRLEKGKKTKILEEGKEICEFCSEMLELAEKVVDMDFIVEDSVGDLEILGRFFRFCKEEVKQDFYDGSRLIFDLEGKGRYGAVDLPPGIYVKDALFENLAERAIGGEYLGIFRADVDELGSTFANLQKGKEKRSALSRAATLSSMLTLFFKKYVPEICKSTERFFKSMASSGEKYIVVVYAGGDDLFIVGSWNDVLDVVFDIREKFRKFTGDTLTISGGFAVIKPKTEVFRMAKVVGEYEDMAKSFRKNDKEKDAISFGSESIYVDGAVKTFEKVERWSDATDVLKIIFDAFLEDGKLRISRSFLRKVFMLDREARIDPNSKLYIPKFLYHMVRNVKDEKLWEQFEEVVNILGSGVSSSALQFVDIVARGRGDKS